MLLRDTLQNESQRSRLHHCSNGSGTGTWMPNFEKYRLLLTLLKGVILPTQGYEDPGWLPLLLLQYVSLPLLPHYRISKVTAGGFKLTPNFEAIPRGGTEFHLGLLWSKGLQAWTPEFPKLEWSFQESRLKLVIKANVRQAFSFRNPSK